MELRSVCLLSYEFMTKNSSISLFFPHSQTVSFFWMLPPRLFVSSRFVTWIQSVLHVSRVEVHMCQLFVYKREQKSTCWSAAQVWHRINDDRCPMLFHGIYGVDLNEQQSSRSKGPFLCIPFSFLPRMKSVSAPALSSSWPVSAHCYIQLLVYILDMGL